MIQELGAHEVRKVCDPVSLGLRTTADMSPSHAIIGQARAVEALEFGLGIQQTGFNVYVAGPPGTGKRTALENYLSDLARKQPTPSDLCYVYSFEDPYRPRALLLPPGRGRTLQEDMRNLIATARAELPRAFESDEYVRRQEDLHRELERRRESLLTEMNQEAFREGFTIQSSPMGVFLVPTRNGQPMAEQDFRALSEEEQERLRRTQQRLDDELKNRMKQMRRLQQEAQVSLEQLNRGIALNLVGGLIEDLEDKNRDYPAVLAYLGAVREDIVSNIGEFLPAHGEPKPQDADGPVPQVPNLFFRRYEVNLLVSRQEGSGAPVVNELNGSYTNIFGRIEKEAIFGALHTDFTLIRAGSLHQANGGYLVVPVHEILTNPLSYDSLKRAIRNREIAIEEPTERLGLVSTRSLRPEPVPLDVKIVLVGSPSLYYMLYGMDDDFRELFRVKADFDSRMSRSPEGVQSYCIFLCTLTDKEGIRPLTAEAAAKIVEHGSRLAEDQEKLSTHFADLADIVREANYWAGSNGTAVIGADDIRKAIRAKVYRSNLVEERIREAMERDILLVDVEGAVPGQVNGLAVQQLGDYAFGHPSRITATVGVGQGGLLDIEREARLGGPFHTKGVLIMSGFLIDHFAQNHPLSLNARLVFEQSYGMVDGDSASSTELYALLSALAEVPINQGIAVTGSVNQRGLVQAIGGVNQKIEGFFDICSAKGLTGSQGAMIPRSNVQNLMLREDIVDAIHRGQFHVWAVSNIAEGIEVLTGMPAGELQPDGSYPKGTVFHLVDRRLQGMAQRLRRFGGPNRNNRAEEAAAVPAPAEDSGQAPKSRRRSRRQDIGSK